MDHQIPHRHRVEIEGTPGEALFGEITKAIKAGAVMGFAMGMDKSPEKETICTIMALQRFWRGNLAETQSLHRALGKVIEKMQEPGETG